MNDLIDVPRHGIPHELQSGAKRARARWPMLSKVMRINLGKQGASLIWTCLYWLMLYTNRGQYYTYIHATRGQEPCSIKEIHVLFAVLKVVACHPVSKGMPQVENSLSKQLRRTAQSTVEGICFLTASLVGDKVHVLRNTSLTSKNFDELVGRTIGELGIPLQE